MARIILLLLALFVSASSASAQELSDHRLRLRVLLGLTPEATDALRKDAQAGDSRAMALLGEAYGLSFGGLHQDDRLAAEWLGRAVDAGQSWAATEAGFFRFRSRHAAEIVQANDVLARARSALAQTAPADAPDPVLEHLARSGLVEAQILLARQYDTGRGAPLDPRAASEMFALAAANGSAEADRELGRAYAEGDGVPVDPSASLVHYRAAAEAGDIPAQTAMGALCVHGAPGQPADAVEAMRWLALAGSRGDEVARRGFAALAVTAGPDAVREALIRAASWQPPDETAPGT